MIIIASREEKELLQRLRQVPTTTNDSTVALTAEVVTLKRQIADLEIQKSKKEEYAARQERELRHMIGLEKKRQEVEIEAAKRETQIAIRESNLAADKKRFEEQLKFNNERFEKMEGYLKDMMGQVLERLPTVTVDMKRGG